MKRKVVQTHLSDFLTGKRVVSRTVGPFTEYLSLDTTVVNAGVSGVNATEEKKIPLRSTPVIDSAPVIGSTPVTSTPAIGSTPVTSTPAIGSAPVTSTPAIGSHHKLSEEQEEIAQSVLDLKNVQVISKAGSGKTTTSIEIANRFFDKYQKRTLILTYNTRLKMETRERINQQHVGIAMECHSYHAAACKFFSPADFEPQEVDNGLLYNAMRHPARRPLDFGLLIIDEAQDMNELYAKFVIHMLKCFPTPPVLMLLGDPFQRIFGFNGADCDFLLQPQKHFAPYVYPSPFVTHHMTICWRITHEMAEFINTKINPHTLQHTSPEWWKANGPVISVLWGVGIRANPTRPPAPGSVVYYLAKKFSDPRCVAEATALFKMYGNDHVALLGSSLKTKTPISLCVDKLGKGQTENWIVLSSESEFKNEENLFSGKRVASTIHKFKGLERKGILLCGMDNFIESRAVANPLDHFNLMYVACTRAKEKLVIQATANNTSKEYATIRASPLEFKSFPKPCAVTELTNYVPFDPILNVREKLFASQELYQCGEGRGFLLGYDDRLIDGRVAGTKEDISAFLGSAVHARLQLLLSGTLISLAVDEKEFDHDMCEWHTNIFKTKRPVDFTWEDLIRYAIVRETCATRYKHHWRQIIPNIGSIKHDLLDRCVVNAVTALYQTVATIEKHGFGRMSPVNTSLDFYGMINLLKHKVQCEVEVVTPVPFSWFDEHANIICGSMDLVVDLSPTHKLIVELKVSNQLRLDHMLQVQMYTSMSQVSDPQIQYTPVVLVANLGEAHQIHLLDVADEFIYRMALRKTGRKFEPSLIKL